jgi:hypothetical protein
MTHKFTFTMWLYRGRMEREHEIEVAYGYTPPIASTMEQPAEGDVVEIISVTGVEYTTRNEDEIIQEEAERRALDDYTAWRIDMEEYRAEAIREERMIRDFQA